MRIERHNRFWRVIDDSGDLVCVVVYLRGAREVVRRLNGKGDSIVNPEPYCAPPSSPFRLTVDSNHHYAGLWGSTGECRIRIYRDDSGGVAVIATQLPTNKGTSITNLAESLATETWCRLRQPVDFRWIEHYPPRGGWQKLPESFDLVTFKRTSAGFRNPQWRKLTKRQVEAILGCPLGD